jgi:excisionase family DNA binding protein
MNLSSAFLRTETSNLIAVGPYIWERADSMADAREVMNLKQASQYLGVSPDTLYKYVYEEKIPAFKLGNRWKFKKSLIDAWMNEMSTVREERGKKKPKPARMATAR